MVVTCFPAARDTGVLQERTGRPSRCTVQAPHCATPQPYFVPVRPRCSRKTQSSGVEGSASRCTVRLFTVREIIRVNLLHASNVSGQKLRARTQESASRCSARLPGGHPALTAIEDARLEGGRYTNRSHTDSEDRGRVW